MLVALEASAEEQDEARFRCAEFANGVLAKDSPESASGAR